MSSHTSENGRLTPDSLESRIDIRYDAEAIKANSVLMVRANSSGPFERWLVGPETFLSYSKVDAFLRHTYTYPHPYRNFKVEKMYIFDLDGEAYTISQHSWPRHITALYVDICE